MNIVSVDSASLPLRGETFVAGALCRVSTNSATLIHVLPNWPCPAGASRQSFALKVLVNDQIVHSRRVAPHFRGIHHLVFAVFADDEFFTFDLARHEVSGVVSGKTAADGSFWKNLLLPIALGVLGPMIGVVPLHAACLDWNGTGLMIAGESGVGKSILAVALSKRGFSLVSDDWTYVVLNRNQITAYGTGALVKLLPDSPSLFPELKDLQAAPALNGEMAFEVDPARVFGSALRSQVDPRIILLLERDQERRCELLPLPKEGAREFFETNLERLPSEFAQADARRRQAIDELTNRDCRLLRYGGPPQVAVDAIRRFCQESCT